MDDCLAKQNEELEILSAIYGNKLKEVEIDPFTKGFRGEFTAYLKLPADKLRLTGLLQSEEALTLPNGEGFLDSIEIASFPPLTVNFSLPNDYPNHHSEPQFLINCLWLTSSHLNLLSEMLNHIYLSNIGKLVLNEIFNYLENDYLLTLLGWQEDSFVFDCAQQYADASERDKAYKIALLIDYDDVLRQNLFLKSKFSCPICSDDDIPGQNIFKMVTCQHYCCKTCLSQALETFLQNSGLANVFSCLQCDEKISIQDLRYAIPQELFQRFDNLTLVRGLSKMRDVAECPSPSCGTHVVIDQELNKGCCPKCSKSFCAKCARPYHGLGKCADEDDDDPAERPPEQELLEVFRESRGKYRDFLNRVYKLEKVEKEDNEKKSSDLLSQFLKCPNNSCGIPVEKISGCNRMQCTSCKQVFCYICGIALIAKSAYNHVNACKIRKN